MRAVFSTGGKQYRVSEGDILRVEKLATEEGGSVDFDRVLMVSDGDDVKIGKPYIAGGKVTAKVRSHGRHRKIRIIKFKRRKHYLKHMGHRQAYTELEITGIAAD
jgi:large subunit ribosomal protein L21